MTTDWNRSTPDAEGIDADAVTAFDADLRAGEYGQVDSFLLIRHDRVVHESTYVHDYAALNATRTTQSRYYDATRFPWHGDTGLHTVQSITKSVTATVIGIAIERGDMPDVDTPVLDFFAGHDVAHVDAAKRHLTLRHLLTMRAGFAWDETTVTYSDPANDCARMEESDDWVAFAMNRPMVDAPGTVFRYSSGVSQILSHIVRAATGRTVDDYARQHLLAPLGIDAFHWDLTPTGLPDTEGGLFLRPDDLARLGQLYLRRGTAKGRRIFSEAWVDRCMHPATPDTGKFDPAWSGRAYGWQWWLLRVPRDAGTDTIWTGLGFGGQRLYVVPWLDLVTVFTGWNVYDRPGLAPGVFLERVLPAVRGD